MKIIQLYQCEICGTTYDSESAALACEGRGKDDGERWPIGLVYAYGKDDHLYAPITFAVAGYYQTHSSKHSKPEIFSWACRDMPNPHGDCLGENTCGSKSHNSIKRLPPTDPETPHFRRLVAWLQSQSIPVTVWDGSKPVPLDDFMRAFELPCSCHIPELEGAGQHSPSCDVFKVR